MIEIEIKAIIQNGLQPKNFQVFMSEVKGIREFFFNVSITEGKSLLMILNTKKANISTYQLYLNSIHKLNVQIIKTEILHYDNNEFFGQLVLRQSDDILQIVDINIIDAVALSVLSFCPIMIDENCLDMLIDEQKNIEKSTPFIDKSKAAVALQEVQTTYLEKMLSLAIQQEEYEKAIAIRKELQKRKQS